MTMHRKFFTSESLVVLRRLAADAVPTVEAVPAPAREQ